MKIIDNKAYKITKLGDYSYSLYSKGGYKSQIYSSLLKPDILTSAFLDQRKNTIFFTAEIVQTLEDYLQSNKKMTEPECVKVIITLSTQIKYLEENNYVIYGYDLNDILVINGNTFIIANSNYILPIQNNTFTFYDPNGFPYFSNPELIKLTNLPTTIHYKSSYYRLGVLITFLLTTKYLLVSKEIMNDKSIEMILRPFFYSKIYWFLKRCFNKNCEQRVLLYI